MRLLGFVSFRLWSLLAVLSDSGYPLCFAAPIWRLQDCVTVPSLMNNCAAQSGAWSGFHPSFMSESCSGLEYRWVPPIRSCVEQCKSDWNICSSWPKENLRIRHAENHAEIHSEKTLEVYAQTQVISLWFNACLMCFPQYQLWVSLNQKEAEGANCDFTSNYSVGEFVDISSQESKNNLLPGCFFSWSRSRLNLSLSGAVIKQVLTSLIQRVVFIYLVEIKYSSSFDSIE